MRNLALLCATLLLLNPHAGWAAKADRQRPLIIQGGEGSALITQTAERAELIGPVTVTQGSLLLRASRVSTARQPDDTLKLEAHGAEGAPVRFSQSLDKPGETVEAQANQVEYDERSGIARFIGNARLRKLGNGQMLNELSSPLIVYNTVTDELRTEGKADGKPGPQPGGPRIIIMPKGAASEPTPSSPALPLQTSPALKQP